MAGEVPNIKVCSPLKLRSGLTEKFHATCHYSYNLPLTASLKKINWLLSKSFVLWFFARL